MIIEGPMLMGVLIIVALAIAALLVYIRLAVRKDDPEAESLFSRLMKFGSKDEEEEDEDGQETRESQQAGPAGMGLKLPGIGRSRGHASAEPAKKRQDKNKMPGIQAGGLFSSLFGGRKSNEKIKEEVQAIDEQLNSVLQESAEISVTGMQPEIGTLEMPLSDGLGMRELDIKMGALNEPAVMPPADFQMDVPIDVQNPIVAPGGTDNGKEGSETFARYFDADPGQVRDIVSEARRLRVAFGKPVGAPMDTSTDNPAGTGLNKPETATEAEAKKPDALQAPPVAEPMKPPADSFVPETKTMGDDLLADLEADARQEELIDMSIMKEYQDMPITCVELESDLKGILDQITINMHGKGRQQA
ncbi:MAG: hypothetical protein A4E28_01853 [Methanocella sp. PtaU1.Bin125]|nr:MAG: hypothetical protein A4E28_01853 [Methanocella sp. PtaU1.Bin125]